MKKFACLAMLFLTAGMMAAPVHAENPKVVRKADMDKLAGTYRIISGERNGAKLTEDRLHAVSVRIAAGTITTLDKMEKEIYVATYTLDTKAKPWRILMTATVSPGNSKGTKAEGLIERNGDTVKLIYALPGGTVPNSFKTSDKQQMFVMKRANL